MAIIKTRNNFGMGYLGAEQSSGWRAAPTTTEQAAGVPMTTTPPNETREEREARRATILDAALAKHYADNPQAVPDAREIAKQTAALTYDPSRWTKAAAALAAAKAAREGGGGKSVAAKLPGLAGWGTQQKVLAVGGAVVLLTVLYMALKKKAA